MKKGRRNIEREAFVGLRWNAFIHSCQDYNGIEVLNTHLGGSFSFHISFGYLVTYMYNAGRKYQCYGLQKDT